MTEKVSSVYELRILNIVVISFLGLPTREYFLESTNHVYLEAYKNYLVKIATLLGAPNEAALKQADEIVKFEIK